MAYRTSRQRFEAQQAINKSREGETSEYKGIDARGPSSVTEPEGVCVMVTFAESALTQLGDAIDVLADTLSPVLVSASPEQTCEAAPDRGEPQVVTDLRVLINRINGLRYTVEEIQARARI